MDIIIISLASFATAILTFFSGFGLGTILTPVFAIFFPVEIAIALTGVVHFFTNIFKVFLIGRHADKDVLIRFGIPAAIASFIGAWVLIKISGIPSFLEYHTGNQIHTITLLKIIIAILLITFALFEIIPSLKKKEFDRNKLPLGGFLSGFFGGLSGMQGAIRGAFLIKSGLTKEAFIGTSVIIACFIDITRLTVYATRFMNSKLLNSLELVIPAIVAAFLGAYLGNRLLKKITFEIVQRIVAVMLIGISLALGSGLI